MKPTLILALCCASLQPLFAEMNITRKLIYTGMCDASAAVPVATSHFIVANDEDSIIRVYRRDEGGAPVQTIDLGPCLDLKGPSDESDLEGACRVGDRIYWITSHGRSKKGKARPNRTRFFATTRDLKGGRVQLDLVGTPYKLLLADLAAEPRLNRFDLAAAASRAPKKKGALNIEGLAPGPNGELLIGFRNPIPNGDALVVPLLNPAEVVEGQRARFGDPILLNLGGLGIREVAFWAGSYLLVGGSYDGSGPSKFFRWPGPGRAPELLPREALQGFNPEAVIVYPDKGWQEFQILSDDGAVEMEGKPCKELPRDLQRFRSWRVEGSFGR